MQGGVVRSSVLVANSLRFPHQHVSLSFFPQGLFVMCAAIIYTVMSPDDSPRTQFGYAYVLAWVAFPLSLISGLIYIVLRKKE